MAGTQGDGATQTRLDRRKARTRAALIAAARDILADQGQAEVSIQAITDAADVGFGSFYNHFQSKAELFDAAIAETLAEHTALINRATSALDDPAEVFAASLRLTVRLRRTHPQMARILLKTGLSYVTGQDGMAASALRDIEAARDAGRFTVDDPLIALACAAGALLGLLQLLETFPDMDMDAATASLTVNVLRMFGMDAQEAHRIAALPLAPLQPETGARSS
ncbi:TetR/AcrR family transcriptional regulator [Actinomadura rupiterrae]|uniref:TetR/AcrR family transcriptional regulator n=1 Tax=Actinomadura rupiterrae TaxID=559627 RepID=UPI0020A531F9|nr:TetR/AcrR family transcriptional regulator [Actinomadura rupiterrae]MCP2343201.1 AcrR family transcriptional regulator [Actinomadura rupiterrae]